VRRRARRGTALVAALFTIALLATVTATVGVQARSSAGFAINQHALTVARLMAESGILAGHAQLTAELQQGLARQPMDSAGLDAVWDDVARRETGRGAGAWVADSLADGAFEVAVVNVSARLDVNTADATSLDALFRTVAPPAAARETALRIAARVRGDAAADGRPGSGWRATDSLVARDSLIGALLGREVRSTARLPMRSLDELEELVGRDAPWLTRLADQLTVDGDGRVDRRHAAPSVLAAATGALVDRPTRILLVARGWQRGHPLTREIQAVYDVSGPTLTLVRWREIDR